MAAFELSQRPGEHSGDSAPAPNRFSSSSSSKSPSAPSAPPDTQNWPQAASGRCCAAPCVGESKKQAPARRAGPSMGTRAACQGVAADGTLCSRRAEWVDAALSREMAVKAIEKDEKDENGRLGLESLPPRAYRVRAPAHPYALCNGLTGLVPRACAWGSWCAGTHHGRYGSVCMRGHACVHLWHGMLESTGGPASNQRVPQPHARRERAYPSTWHHHLQQSHCLPLARTPWTPSDAITNEMEVGLPYLEPSCGGPGLRKRSLRAGAPSPWPP